MLCIRSGVRVTGIKFGSVPAAPEGWLALEGGLEGLLVGAFERPAALSAREA
jgi:hypothetical protein